MLQRTIDLIVGVLTRPNQTLDRESQADATWRQTARILTAPVLVGAAILSALTTALLTPEMPGVTLPNPASQMIFGLLLGVASVVVLAGIASALAKSMGGRPSFDRAFTAVSLAIVPGQVGVIVDPVPMLGRPAALALLVYTLVLLYKGLWRFLGVPEGRRPGHYIVTLVAAIVVMLVIGWLLRAVIPGATPTVDFERAGDTGVGMSEHVRDARADTYDPPEDGRLTERQVTAFLNQARAGRRLYAKRIEKVQRAISPGDSIMDGVQAAMSASGTISLTLEEARMEAVKRAGGNWAEFEWVRERLKAALNRPDASGANRYNADLIEPRQDQVRQALQGVTAEQLGR